MFLLDSDLTMDDLGHPNGSPAHSGSHGNLASAADYDYLIKFLALGRYIPKQTKYDSDSDSEKLQV